MLISYQEAFGRFLAALEAKFLYSSLEKLRDSTE